MAWKNLVRFLSAFEVKIALFSSNEVKRARSHETEQVE